MFRAALAAFLAAAAAATDDAGSDLTCTADGSGCRPGALLTRPQHEIPAASWQHDASTSLAEPGPLSREQIAQYYEDGYLLLPRFHGKDVLAELKADVIMLIENLAKRLFAAGKIRSLYADLDWTERLHRMTLDFPDAPLVLIKAGILPPNFQRLYANASVLDMARQLGIGSGAALNAAWNLRAKMPTHEATVVPWHQDNSYFEPRIWRERVMSVWVALVDATAENGCLQFIRGGHKSGKTAPHTIGTTTSTWYTELSTETAREHLVPDGTDLDIVTVEAPAGSVIIFEATTPHRSLNSVSDRIRWSTDFRLHGISASWPGSSGKPLDWFYGLKDSLLLRDPERPDFVPDWATWANIERTAVQDAAVGLDAERLGENFDPVIVGPWMDLWNITEHIKGKPNIHISRYLDNLAESGDATGAKLLGVYRRSGNW